MFNRFTNKLMLTVKKFMFLYSQRYYKNVLARCYYEVIKIIKEKLKSSHMTKKAGRKLTRRDGVGDYFVVQNCLLFHCDVSRRPCVLSNI
jgi:hypothetical protein